MPNNAPAEGERAAIRGFVVQYRDVAASLIYERLLSPNHGALQSISLVDPRAEKLDDVQITSATSHDAYQVKWVSDPAGVTLRSLTTSSGDDESPLRQLYDAWVALRDAYTDQKIIVHWVTNAPPSQSAERRNVVGDGARRPETPTMAAFLRDVHLPFAEGARPIPARWKTAWRFVRRAIGSPPARDFDTFMESCRFDLNYSAVEPDLEPSEKQQRTQDIRAIWASLLNEVADSPRGQRLHLSRKELLNLTGLGDRLRPTSHHDFPRPDIPYVSIEATLQEIGEALEQLPGGYIGILGSPGSGKSTLLSSFARDRIRAGDLVVQYYAYTGDGEPKAGVRSESEAFLRDVVLEFHNQGVGALEVLPGPSRLSYLDGLHRQLSDLGKRYQETGAQAVLVIDGLDHVPRQHPVRGFLADLPLPSQLPDGVFIVVGSQTEKLPELPPAIQNALAAGEPSRIDIKLLTRVDVAYVLREADSLPDLPSDAVENAFEKTEGHPLALALLVHRLRDSQTTEEAEEIIGSAALPAKLYADLWKQVERDHAVCHLLGLVARVPGPIDLVWISEWFDSPTAVSQVFREYRHLFRRESDDRWHFFHDSFRAFLLEQTEAYMPGGWGKALHSELAANAGRSNSPHSWTELYHSDLAEKRERVATLSQPRVAREQFVAFRPSSSITGDLATAAGHAAESGDTALLCALAAASEEIAQRETVLDRYTGSTLLDLARFGRLRDAARFARSGRTLLIHPTTALHLVSYLHDGGLLLDAEQLFDLAAPRDLFVAEKSIGRDFLSEKQYRLLAWARVAPLFSKLDAIAESIGKVFIRANELHSDDRRYDENDLEATSRLRRKLFLAVSKTLIEDSRSDDLKRWVMDLADTAIPIEDDGDGDWAAWHRSLAKAESRLDAARTSLERQRPEIAASLLQPFEEADDELIRDTAEDFGFERTVQVAEALQQSGADEVAVLKWLPDFSDGELRPFTWLSRDKDPWLRAVRLRSIFEKPPPDLTRSEPESSDEGFLRFQRAVAGLAEFSARARRGERKSSDTVLSQLVPLFTQFPNVCRNPYRDQIYWKDHIDIVNARAWLYAQAVETADEHGPAARKALLAHLSDLHPSPEPVVTSNPDEFWTADDIRSVAIAAHRCHTPSTWIQAFLSPLERDAKEREDVDGRTQTFLELADTWNEAGRPDEAVRLLQRALRESLGVGYRKDYQLARIVSLLGWLLDAGRATLDDRDAAKWVAHLARVIVHSSYGTETKQASVAAQELVAVAFRWHPPKGANLALWFRNEDLGWEPLVTLEVIRAAVAVDASTIPFASDVLLEYMVPRSSQKGDLRGSYPDLTEFIVERAAEDYDVDTEALARDISARIDHLVSEESLGSAVADEWKAGVGAALRALGSDQVAIELGIPEPDRVRSTFDDAEPVLGLGDPERELSWGELRNQVASSSLPDVLAGSYTSEEVSVWRLAIVNFLPGLTETQTVKVADFVFGHPELLRSDVEQALFQHLADLGQRELAWRFGERLLQHARSHYDPWIPGGGGPGYNITEALINADPDGARPVVLRLLAEDAAVRPSTVFPWLSSLLPFLSATPDPSSHWSPIEDYLRALAPNATSDPIPTWEYGSDESDAYLGLTAYVFSLLTISTENQGLRRAILSELQRGDYRMTTAVEHALAGPDPVRRSLLYTLDSISVEVPIALWHLRPPLLRIAPSLPDGLQAMAQRITNRIESETVNTLLDLGDR